MRKSLKVQVKETSYALILDVCDDGAETMPTLRCLRRICVRTLTKELTLERDWPSEVKK